MRLIPVAGALAVVCGMGQCRGDVVYAIDDGSANLAIGIDPGEDMVWFNRFPVEPGGEVINSVSAAYGRPGLAQALNGLSVTILLYQDSNGGSPQDAVLLRSVAATVAGANTNTLNVYPFEPTTVVGELLVGVLFRNTTGLVRSIAALDTTAPSLSERSYVGFAVGLDPGNLGAIPAANFGTIEGFGSTGNFLIRANGVAVPGPGTALAAGAWLVGGRRRRR